MECGFWIEYFLLFEDMHILSLFLIFRHDKADATRFVGERERERERDREVFTNYNRSLISLVVSTGSLRHRCSHIA